MDASSSEDINNNSDNIDSFNLSDEIPVTKSAFKFQFQYRINGVGLTKGDIKEKLTSPVYRPHVPFNLLSWRLHVYPSGIDANSKGYVTVQLELITDNKNCTISNTALRRITFKIGILNHANRLIAKNVQTTNFSERNLSFPMNFYKLPFFSALKNESTAPLTNDTLILRCKVTYDESLLCQIVPPVDLNEISSLHQQQVLTDVILRIHEPQEGSDDDENEMKERMKNCGRKYREIKAHKVILASRSPVFATMFSRNNYYEASNSIVNISDISFQTVQQLIHFIYTGNIKEMDEDMAIELLYASEKYDIERLKNVCARYLSAHLTCETAVHVEAIADSFNLHHLKHLASKKLNLN